MKRSILLIIVVALIFTGMAACNSNVSYESEKETVSEEEIPKAELTKEMLSIIHSKLKKDFLSNGFEYDLFLRIKEDKNFSGYTYASRYTIAKDYADDTEYKIYGKVYGEDQYGDITEFNYDFKYWFEKEPENNDDILPGYGLYCSVELKKPAK